jgi:hypothetical protein
MAISASSIASSSTLNELRTQFNNLVTDVTAIEGGSISYTTLNTTTTNATTLNVKEDGTIVFEGATDDEYETTLTVVDPTADRTITFPNETGTVHTSGGTTTHTNIIIGDAGNIGSASDTNAISIGADGDVTLTQDLELQHDGAILSFGADDDTTLTHTDGSGLTLNSTNKLMFNDASQFIQGASATVLDIAATDEIELTATLIDIVGRAEISGNLTVGGDLDVTGSFDMSDANITNVGSIALDSISGDGDANSSITFSGSDVITIATGGSTAATFNASQVTTLSGNLIIPDAGNIGSASDTDAIAIGSDGDITLTQDLELQHDGAILSFGANDEIALTHVHDTGLLLTDSGGTPTLQLHDSAESVSSDGSKLILTSNSVAFNLPTADGTSGQVLKTDGSGTLSFVTASANTPTSADGQALGSASLEWSDLFLADASTIQFGNDQEIRLTHVADTGLLLTDSGGTPTLQFHDANESFASDGSKIIMTSGGTTFNMPTSDGTNGQALATDGSGTLSFVSVAANTPSSADGQALGSASLEWSDLFLADGGTIQFGNDQEIRLTHVADTGLTLTHTASGDDKPIVLNLKSEEDDLASGEEIGRIDFTAGDSGGTDAITTAASIAAVAEDTFASDNNSTGLAFKLGVSAAATEMFRMDHDGDFKVLTDGSAIAFGANNEIELTHVHNTGLLLTDSGGTPTLQLHDSNESIASDGSRVIITSGGTAFSLPTSDGSNTQVLQTNGSGVLSFVDAAGNIAFNAYEYTATASQTSFSGSDDNSATLAYTAGVNSVQVYVNGVLLDSSDYTATNGTHVVLGVGAAVNDMIKINAVQVTNVASADMDGAELVLDADGDTSIRANTDDQIDFKLANAIDITMGANAMNILSGTTLTIDSGATITNSGTANGFGLSTGKAIVLAMLFGR